jgi:hypothetical protein
MRHQFGFCDDCSREYKAARAEETGGNTQEAAAMDVDAPAPALAQAPAVLALFPSWPDYIARNPEYGAWEKEGQDARRKTLRPQSAVSDDEYEDIAEFLQKCLFYVGTPIGGPEDPRHDNLGWVPLGTDGQGLKHFCDVCQFSYHDPAPGDVDPDKGPEEDSDEDAPGPRAKYHKVLYLSFKPCAFRIRRTKNKKTGKRTAELRFVREINDESECLSENAPEHPAGFIFRIMVQGAGEREENDVLEV